MSTQTAGTQLIDRSIAVLNVLSENGADGLRASALARLVGLNVATTYRILSAFQRHGWVDRERATRRYRLGANVFVLGARAADGVGMRRLCRPALLSLTAKTEDTVFLLVRSGLNIVCIDLLQGASGILARMQYVGAALPLGAGTGSIAVMSCLPDDEVQAILSANSARYPEFNTSERYIRQALKKAQHRGYAVSHNNEIPGLAAVAMPVRARGRDIVAAISVNMFGSRFSDDRVLDIVALLRNEISIVERSLQTVALQP